MDNKFYRISKNVIFITWVISFALGVVITSIKTVEISEKYFLAIFAFLFFVLGAHTLFYRKLWVDDTVQMMTKHLENKPKWYQNWLSIRKSVKYNKIVTVFMGIFFIALSILFLIKILFRI